MLCEVQRDERAHRMANNCESSPTQRIRKSEHIGRRLIDRERSDPSP